MLRSIIAVYTVAVTVLGAIGAYAGGQLFLRRLSGGEPEPAS